VDGFDVDTVGKYEEELFAFVEQKHPAILEGIKTKKKIDDELDGQIKAALEAFGNQFQA
jgi:F-type H+-transporting ATPase subunit alpha